ncbi:intradiol ring-cleavage dioxygenase [Streptomyces sp. MBT53]|uniref:intradiol ring-cleavage dioxygenase n=1 Tax=Streptomyces sp. MBT53 TaxID=1488384 RepID=UPI001911D16B|nr:intradiol ring-cleavage dioxygenase [Streptomyces sp. MBT53]MBK6015462.1 intradiol ring-cleavage dioxygenase [Streptomyces sp. MBT53]
MTGKREHNEQPDQPTARHRRDKGMQRRRVLIGGGTAALAGGLVAAGLASADTVTSSTTATDQATSTVSTDASASASASTGVCTLTAEVTEGPYSLDGALVRTDLREEKEGVEVQYTFTVVDQDNDCAPLADAFVELWHCDALGEYSGYVGKNGHTEDDDGTFLRGGQLTDTSGQVSLISIWPGHYVSRAVHVHMRVHTGVTVADGTYTGGTVVHTGQLFFDADLNEKVQATSPYSDNTTAETVLADDTIYDDGGSASGLLTLTALGTSVSDGYTATLTVGVSTT